jgi:hypothetical protein
MLHLNGNVVQIFIIFLLFECVTLSLFYKTCITSEQSSLLLLMCVVQSVTYSLALHFHRW